MTAPPESATLGLAWRARLTSIAMPAGLALVVFAGVLLVFGKNPIKAYVDIFGSTLGSAYGFSETLVKMTPARPHRGGGGDPGPDLADQRGRGGPALHRRDLRDVGRAHLRAFPGVAAAAPHDRARLSRRGALGAHRRPPARQGLGQRDDLHPPHELHRHPVAELRRLRAVEGPRRGQLPADRRVRPGRDPPGARAEPRASGPRPGAAGGRAVRVLRLPHALGPRDARHRRQCRRRPAQRPAGRPLRDRADVHRRRSRRPRRDVRGLRDPGAAPAEPLARLRLHRLPHQLDGRRPSARHPGRGLPARRRHRRRRHPPDDPGDPGVGGEHPDGGHPVRHPGTAPRAGTAPRTR